MDGFFNALATLISNFKNSLGIILIPVAVLCVGINAFKIVMASDQKEVASAKKWLIAIIIGIVIFYGAEPFVKAIASISESIG